MLAESNLLVCVIGLLTSEVKKAKSCSWDGLHFCETIYCSDSKPANRHCFWISDATGCGIWLLGVKRFPTSCVKCCARGKKKMTKVGRQAFKLMNRGWSQSLSCSAIAAARDWHEIRLLGVISSGFYVKIYFIKTFNLGNKIITGFFFLLTHFWMCFTNAGVLLLVRTRKSLQFAFHRPSYPGDGKALTIFIQIWQAIASVNEYTPIIIVATGLFDYLAVASFPVIAFGSPVCWEHLTVLMFITQLNVSSNCS